MAHCGVPLHCYGQGKVDGGSEAALCQGEQDGYKVQVERVLAQTESIMISSEVKFNMYIMDPFLSHGKLILLKSKGR